jgi:hypothetical protein
MRRHRARSHPLHVLFLLEEARVPMILTRKRTCIATEEQSFGAGSPDRLVLGPGLPRHTRQSSGGSRASQLGAPNVSQDDPPWREGHLNAIPSDWARLGFGPSLGAGTGVPGGPSLSGSFLPGLTNAIPAPP